MNVLYVANSSRMAGGNKSLLLLATFMRDNGHKVFINSPDGGDLVKECKQKGLNCIVRAIEQPSLKRLFLSFRCFSFWFFFLRFNKISVVHANDPFSARQFLLPSFFARVPVVVHLRFPVDESFAKWVFRFLPEPQLVVFNSMALRNECAQLLLSKSSNCKLMVLYNAVNFSSFYPMSLKSKDFRVTILAHLSPVKGYEDFLHMASIIVQSGVSVRFDIIGEESTCSGYRDKLLGLAQALGVDKYVNFLGYREDVNVLLNKTTVLVCCSHVEPFGRCLIEAMACGKPVVGTRVGGIPEVIDDGKTGLIVPPKSPDLLASAVLKLLHNPELCESMGMAGVRRVKTLFSDEHISRKMLNVYSSLCSKSRGCLDEIINQ